MPEHADRPWTVHYTAGVPAEIEIPDEPVTAGLQRSAQRWPDRVATDFMGATATFAQTEDAVRRAMVVLDELGPGPARASPWCCRTVRRISSPTTRRSGSVRS